jgi:hypothetical protein
MIIHAYRLEFLPNEILIECFRYLYADELFELFYRLNSRFHCLIPSLTHLTYKTKNKTNDHFFYLYIRTLYLCHPIDDHLFQFNRIRRLYLTYVTDAFMKHWNTNILFNLEFLSIDYCVHPCYMSELRRKIFSSQFPRLYSCSIARMPTSLLQQTWTQSLAIRILRVNEINGAMFILILSVCPNLFDFTSKLSMKSTILSPVSIHRQLKHLTLHLIDDDWPWNDHMLDDYLVCVPDIEQLRLYRTIARHTNTIDDYLAHYDWLSSIIIRCCFHMKSFLFHVNINQCRTSTDIDRWKTNFSRNHINRYTYRLVI